MIRNDTARAEELFQRDAGYVERGGAFVRKIGIVDRDRHAEALQLLDYALRHITAAYEADALCFQEIAAGSARLRPGFALMHQRILPVGPAQAQQHTQHSKLGDGFRNHRRGVG